MTKEVPFELLLMLQTRVTAAKTPIAVVTIYVRRGQFVTLESHKFFAMLPDGLDALLRSCHQDGDGDRCPVTVWMPPSRLFRSHCVSCCLTKGFMRRIKWIQSWLQFNLVATLA